MIFHLGQVLAHEKYTRIKFYCNSAMKKWLQLERENQKGKREEKERSYDF